MGHRIIGWVNPDGSGRGNLSRAEERIDWWAAARVAGKIALGLAIAYGLAIELLILGAAR